MFVKASPPKGLPCQQVLSGRGRSDHHWHLGFCGMKSLLNERY